MQRRYSGVVVGLVLAGYLLPARADWQGSYEVQGECYCSGLQPAEVRFQKQATPVGLQTVEQICARVGTGPALEEDDGIFNYPVYADPQCGNGPFPAASQPVDPSCVGTLDTANTLCLPAGPRWNLGRAYAEDVLKSATADTDPTPDSSADSVAATSTPAASSAATPAASASDSGSSVLKPTYADARPATTPSSSGVLRPRYIDPATLRAATTTPAPETAAADARDTATADSDATTTGTTLPRETLVDDTRGSLEQRLEQTRVREAGKRQETPEQRRLRQERLMAEARERLRARETAVEQAPADSEIAAAPTGTDAEAPAVAPLEAATPQTAQVPRESASEVPEPETTVAEAPVDEAPIESAAREVATPAAPATTAASGVPALRLPTAVRASAREFNYVDAMPLGYDYGGGGVQLEGSTSSHGRVHYLARIGMANEYRELLVGAGYHFTPPAADRVTVVLTAGVEAGQFQLEDQGLETNYSDSGLYLGASTRYVVNNRFELQGGVSYSSFFEGDAALFGAGRYHLNRQLDVTTGFELGDNDSLGIGLRYYY